MTTPTVLPLEFYSGDDETLRYGFKSKSTGLPVDLTGATARFQVRTATDSPAAILDIVGVIDGPAGTIEFPVTASETASLTPDNVGPIEYVHDMQVTYSNGINWSFFGGPVTAFADVTRVP
jgi:hypothetical protein